MTFTEAAAIELSKWENWRWTISTSITIISIFGAAYWAQSIFNKNALKREDRDRRLNSLIELNEVIMSLQVDVVVKSGKIDYLLHKFNDLNGKLIHMKTLIGLHELNITTSLERFSDGLLEFRLTLDELESVYQRSEDPEYLRKIREAMSLVIVDKIVDPIDELLADTALQFHEIKSH